MNLSRANIKLVFFVAFFVFSPILINAAEFQGVLINEIAWMGSLSSSNDEWIELYNKTDEKIIIDNWILKSDDSSPEIKLKGEILANDFFLLERTDDNSVPTILADQIYGGALENSGENLVLVDNNNNIIDSLNCSGGWTFGDNSTKQTMERKKFTVWQNSKNPGGTPKSENSEINLSNTFLEEPTNNTLKTYPKNIFINEILPSPEGTDENNEWIEIYNNNGFEVNLFGWEIKDLMGSSKSFIFKDTIIQPYGFLIIYRPESKIVLNNDGDKLVLINPSEEIISEISYENSPRNQSYNKIGEGFSWSKTLTPGKKNIITLDQQNVLSNTDENINLKEISKENVAIDDNKASLIESIPKKKTLSFLLIPIITSFLSAIIILVLKRKAIN